ncbi:MAG: hypothetical protein EHM55_14010 [Acidobacteria bacterium]|nr:MAG: hypothetical protein EHM55_14010 [Acidobacteriota bacterium]
MKLVASLNCRLLALGLSFIAGSATIAQVITSLEGSYILPGDHPAIRYRDLGQRNAVARLQEQLATNTHRLAYDRTAGYLPAVLDALEIPVSSQVMVFSKTSFQAARIYPHSPRAIYFNDSVAVGHVPTGDLLELTATDPDNGVVFFTLDQTEEGRPAIRRHDDECLQCHASPRTLGVPGLVVRSVYPDRTGMPLSRAGSFFTDHRSPLDQRWGGWYVTGTHGTARHMGNQMAADEAGALDADAGANVTDLKRFLNPGVHLTPHSDLVALMVLEHQVRITNLITRVGWETRLALADHASLILPNEAAGEWSESIRRRIERPAEVLVRSLFMLDEHALASPVKGTSGFAEEYSARGPRDGRRRSLYELDLSRRLYRYRFSPLIYSEQFAGLPRDVRDYVYRRVQDVLTGRDRSADFASVSEADRAAILDILRETLPDLPPRP